MIYCLSWKFHVHVRACVCVCVCRDVYINDQMNDSYRALKLVTFWLGVWLTGGLWVMAFWISDKAFLGVASGVSDVWMALPGWVGFSAERRHSNVVRIKWIEYTHKWRLWQKSGKQGNCYTKYLYEPTSRRSNFEMSGSAFRFESRPPAALILIAGMTAMKTSRRCHCRCWHCYTHS